MNKLIPVASAFFAITTVLASGAEAGCHGGGVSFYRSSNSVSYQSPRRVAKRVSRQAVEVAKADKPEVKAVDQVAVTEQSAISSATDKVAEAKPAETKQVVATAKEIGCKKFFPSAGLTLSVSCE